MKHFLLGKFLNASNEINLKKFLISINVKWLDSKRKISIENSKKMGRKSCEFDTKNVWRLLCGKSLTWKEKKFGIFHLIKISYKNSASKSSSIGIKFSHEISFNLRREIFCNNFFAAGNTSVAISSANFILWKIFGKLSAKISSNLDKRELCGFLIWIVNSWFQFSKKFPGKY